MTQHDNSICTLDQLLSYEELCTLETALCSYNPRSDEMEIAKGLKKKLRIARTRAMYAPKPMVYSIRQIREKVAPVARKLGLRAVYLFGSYARGKATTESDIDLLVDTLEPCGLFRSEAIRQELQEQLGKEVDLIHVETTPRPKKENPSFFDIERQRFRAAVERDKVLLYHEDQERGQGHGQESE